MADVGLYVEWQVIHGGDDFFRVTKRHAQRLQGILMDCDAAAGDLVRRYNCANAELFEDDYDYVIIHDPQPAAMVTASRSRDAALDLALSHRPLDAEVEVLGLAAFARRRALRRRHLPPCATT